MITDAPAEAKAAGEALWAVTKDAEKKRKDKQDEVERAKAEAATPALHLCTPASPTCWTWAS